MTLNFKLLAIETINSLLDKLCGRRLVPSIRSQLLPSIEIDQIIDVGVAHGTRFLLDRFPHATYYFVEPSPRYHPYIQKNLCSMYKGKLFPVAAGSSKGQMKLLGAGLSAGFLRKNQEQEASFGNSTTPPIVEVVTLDELCSVNNISIGSKSLLKIDTEGFELEVLKGAHGLLDKVKYVILELRLREIETYNPSEIIDFLYRKNFQWGELIKVAYRKVGPSYIDVIFTRTPPNSN